MKVLTVKQPWAWAMFHAGKDVENRTWYTNHRGPLAIHAGASLDERWWQAMPSGVLVPDSALTTSAIVGIVEVVDCIRNSESRWALPGCWHWLLADNPKPIAPYPCSGAQGLWDAPRRFGHD